MLTRRRLVWSGLLTAVLVVGAACGGGGSGGSASDGKGAKCPLAALKAAKKPVNITMWHQMTSNNGRVFEDITRKFNESQSDVHVNVVDYSSEGSSLTKYKAGLTSGDLPDVVELEETTLQTMMDTKSTLPVQACVDADHYSLSDFVPRVTAYYTIDGVLRSMPYNVSNPVLFYNKTLFRKAGLDPDKPPQTLAEVKEYSDKIMQSGAAKHGLALRMAPFLNEFFYAKDGKLYADHDNGRKGRAQHVLFDTPMGRELWNWFRDMVKSGRALYTSSNEGDATHLLALGTGDAAMTFEGSGVLGPIVNVLESGQYAGTEVGVAPLPDLRPGGGVQTAEGSLWIVSRSAPEKQAAAWQYIKFLDSKAELVDLHLRTGYVPIRKSVAESPEIQALWKKSPEYAVSYEQLVAGPTNPATTGPVIGAFPEVREAVKDGYVSMFVGGKTAEQALKETQARADAAIKDYNDRVAG